MGIEGIITAVKKASAAASNPPPPPAGNQVPAGEAVRGSVIAPISPSPDNRPGFVDFRPAKASAGLSSVWDIADSIHTVPPVINTSYLQICQRAASRLRNPSSAGSLISSDPLLLVNQIMAARNNVFDVMNKVSAFASSAINAGFSPPDNPFTFIAQRNSARDGLRPIDVSESDAAALLANIDAYLDLLTAQSEGTLDLSNVSHTAQLSSIGMSFDGYGGSGNTAVDLLRFLPDADEVKAQKAKEALSVLDFKKRLPKVLFTADYSPDNIFRGTLIGWKKIPDASGYVVKRRNIFTGEEVSFSLTNSDVITRTAHVIEYAKTWALTFYDTIDLSSVLCYLDQSVTPDAYYVYRVQAYQIASQLNGSVFDVETLASNMTLVQRANVRHQLSLIDQAHPETVSPYPALSQQIYGDSQYDWILAGVNVRASVSRQDTRTQTRGYSYLAAQIDFIERQMDAGKFVIPKDINVVIANITDFIGRFGVTQMIQTVFQETGILYFFEGKDVVEDRHFDRVGTESIGDSGIISAVAAAIDPETATLDLRSLSTNLPGVLDGSLVVSSLSSGDKSQSSPTEIDVPANFDAVSTTPDRVQFLQRLGDLGDAQADLTTFDGISKLVRTVRVFSDLGPNRGAPIKPDASPVKADVISTVATTIV